MRQGFQPLADWRTGGLADLRTCGLADGRLKLTLINNVVSLQNQIVYEREMALPKFGAGLCCV